mgnify:CR=1 FL=1
MSLKIAALDELPMYNFDLQEKGWPAAVQSLRDQGVSELVLDLRYNGGGYLFIAISGLFFVALGVFASSLSKNQAVAGILCFTMIFGLIFGVSFLAGTSILNRESLQPARMAVDYAQVLTHRDDFTRGVIDIRPVLFYFTGTILALIFSILSVEAKLLHS